MPTMREAVQAYFLENGFGADGGYSAAWVDIKVGSIPLPLPNTDARRAAVKLHDLNHVLTGYRTDWKGEFEISAWELGAGCRSFIAAWVLNLSGMVGGLFLAPLRTWRAFVAGRGCEAAYALNYEQALDEEVEAVRRQLHVGTARRATVGDVLLFIGACAAGLVLGLLMMLVLLSPVTLALWWRGTALKRAATAS